ncbi:MAG: hypothetical protein KJO36_08210 [Acidimicrobiia bacterium]|nr:hypothetical protein [Acidimicrobiia bacterium]MBT8249416.1 hypothetical protein [Acidimicrobiia bacterium]
MARPRTQAGIHVVTVAGEVRPERNLIVGAAPVSLATIAGCLPHRSFPKQ